MSGTFTEIVKCCLKTLGYVPARLVIHFKRKV